VFWWVLLIVHAVGLGLIIILFRCSILADAFVFFTSKYCAENSIALLLNA